MRTIYRKSAMFLLCAAVSASAVTVVAETPRQAYTRVLGRERALRLESAKAPLQEIRAVIQAYENVARKHPASGYTDNALWQAANLALLAHERFGEAQDKRTGLRILEELKARFPASSLLARAGEVAVRFDAPPAVPQLPATPVATVSEPRGPATLREITRTPLPDGTRVTLELDGEATYRSERLENPRRVFFDFKNVRTIPALQDATLKFSDETVREIRTGRHPNTTRVVIDMHGVDSYSVFTLYEPYRVVVDLQRAAPVAARTTTPAGVDPKPATPEPKRSLPEVKPVPPPVHADAERPADAGPRPPPPAAQTKVPEIPLPKLSAPGAPAVNSNGQFSLARQLGLGISRVVIDAGHGGHDPGARANGLSEAELVLDVALRVARLLEKEAGVDVVMTRNTDVFIPLEERTAIANREAADLFLSIHANASRNLRARGVETYFLNFATNSEAEAVAARENAGSARTMHNLPEIVKAIALNNKIDESRDLAGVVQKSVVRRLSAKNRLLKDLGVKQAPFVVLIGAQMPSVLAEISFVTNKQEAQLLKTAAYRQQIAEALFDGVLRYQQSLKKPRAITSRATGVK